MKASARRSGQADKMSKKHHQGEHAFCAKWKRFSWYYMASNRESIIKARIYRHARNAHFFGDDIALLKSVASS